MAINTESLAKQLGITPQALRRKLRALGVAHAKGARWTSAELATLKKRIKPKAKPAAKKAS